jgi:hypothetical protein
MAGILYKGKTVINNIEGDCDFVELYLKGDGANNSTTITDSSVKIPKACTSINGAKISTAQSKYGGSSLLFTANGECVRVANNNGLWFGTKDFTIEFWTYRLGAHQQFARYLTTRSGDTYAGLYIASGGAGSSNSEDLSVSMSSNGSDFDVPSLGVGNTIKINTWYHIAITRKYNTFRLFVDGIQQSTSSSFLPLFFDSSNFIIGGSDATPNRSVNAHIDSLMINVGLSKYNANFNPETDTGLAY